MSSLVVNIINSVVESIPQTRNLENLKFYKETKGERRGKPFHRKGNSVVIFKVKWRGEKYAMRCYIKGEVHLREIYRDGYYPEELCVHDPINNKDSWIDVVMCRWEDGELLSSVVAEAARRGDQKRLVALSNSFDRLALKLLRCDWSHGDISGENIVVAPNGDLRVIDFDSKFLPEFEGEESACRGTAAYQSPHRKSSDFNRDTDDYSLALISTALKILSINPSIYEQFPYEDGILFNPMKIAKTECEAFNYTKRRLLEMGYIANCRIAEAVENGEVNIPNLADFLNELTKETSYPIDVENLNITFRGSRCGYSNSEGDTVIAHLYDEAFDFKDGYAMAKVENHWFILNSFESTTVCCGEFQEVRSFNGNNCRAMKNNVWGMLFRDGKFVY